MLVLKGIYELLLFLFLVGFKVGLYDYCKYLFFPGQLLEGGDLFWVGLKSNLVSGAVAFLFGVMLARSPSSALLLFFGVPLLK